MAWAVLPLRVTVPLPGVNVPPLQVKFPATFKFVDALNVPPDRTTLPLTVMVAGGVKLPTVWVNEPVTLSAVVLPPAVIPPEVLLAIRLLKLCVVSVPLMDCAELPSRVTVPVPAVKVVPAARVKLPPTVMAAGAVNAPLV